MDEVVSVIRSHSTMYSLHTTRSWEFAGIEENHAKKGDLLLKAKYGKDVIIGLLDSGDECFIDQVYGQSQRASMMKEWDRFQSHGKEPANLEMLSPLQIFSPVFIVVSRKR
ncbi:hypothetical protein RJ639_015548 [Escallonia herrerae]|uniref:Uncharacterized protein n=1 Tax=Escallonia herrerae TaxID=1293975 RepID=A0AA89AL62_9ASTE|nr:hypothetical protein RJ639_015548 [Escallonia herrerae]